MELILKPCPFCGGKGRVRKLKNGYRIVCKECGGSSHYSFIQPWHDNKYVAQCQAAKAWNSRPTSINNPLTLDELRQMDGEPVWVVELNDYPPHWSLIYWHRKRDIVYLTTKSGASICAESFISVGGKVYRYRMVEK